jgi:hypothetical protein
VPDNKQVFFLREQFGGSVGGAIIDNQNIRTVSTDLCENLAQVRDFVIDG